MTEALRLKVAFRVDASLQIGTGHVMRCLTLADALTSQGAQCQFICREHQGNLIDQIRDKGYFTHALPAITSATTNEPAAHEIEPTHHRWLGTTQEQDAQACAAILAELHPDWLIADHYALDARWEQTLKPHYRKLMVIDDLADRPHQCDLLLDQTFGRDEGDYAALVPADCQLLCGSHYALLRPEFSELRATSLERRVKPQLRQVLVSLGGVDKDNATGMVLDALQECPLPAQCQITVAMGSTSPWLAEVSNQVQEMPWETNVIVGIKDMARMMADSDLAIGAAGATTWERCCLGLPTIMLVLAENQRKIASELGKAGAAIVAEFTKSGLKSAVHKLLAPNNGLRELSVVATSICDGQGTVRVGEALLGH
jgi:UDP-2,4-diacetamido-2,4,6-trideoxy-beta-L-altropyranose hydrolase